MAKSKDEELKLDDYNTRLHTEESSAFVRQSLEEVGPFRSIAVDGDNIIRAGNDTFKQAQALGLKVQIVDAEPDTLIAVRRKDLKGRAAVRASILDNRAPELSIWDTGRLSNLMRNDTSLLDGIFAKEKEVADLVGETESATIDTGESPEAVLERLQTKWAVNEGDVWRAASRSTNGYHYLVCNDCTTVNVPAVVGGKVQGIFTSPPYAEQRVKRYGGIPEDEYVAWWVNVQGRARLWLDTGASFFLNIKPHAESGQRSLYVMDLVTAMVRKWGWRYIEEYCWTHAKMPGKDKFRFRNAFEPVYQFCLDERPNIYHDNVARIGDAQIFHDTDLKDKFDGSSIFDNTIQGIRGKILPSNVISAQGTDGIHPAAFPKALAQFFIVAFSNEGERWCDPFVGGGTVLKACELNNRLGVGVDRLPQYIALSLERLEEVGLSPERVS